MTDIGPHLLGRIVSPPDPRNIPLSAIRNASALEVALAQLMASKQVAPATKVFGKAVVDFLQPAPPPPDPTPVGDKVWVNPDAVLDQGNTGHCVGFGWAQWGNSEPFSDDYKNADGHAIYYECKVIDGEPGK